MAILLVEFGELVKVVVVDAIASFDGVELLTSGAEVETLFRPHVSTNASNGEWMKRR